jgi:hypothetical protein
VPSSLAHRRAAAGVVGPWPDHHATQLPPDAEWQRRALAAGLRFSGVRRLTVVKFPSALRPDSYRRREDHEQKGWWQRIQADPAAVEADELATMLRLAADGELERLGTSDERWLPPGWTIRRARVLRGLDPGLRVEMEPLPPAANAATCRVELLSAPATALAGERFLVRVAVHNASLATLASEKPSPVHLACRWLRAPLASGGGPVLGEGRRSVLPEPLAPGAVREAWAEAQAPDEPGRYLLQPVLVQEHVRWLDEPADAVAGAEIVVTARQPAS